MMSKPSGQTIFLAAVIAGSALLTGYLLLFDRPPPPVTSIEQTAEQAPQQPEGELSPASRASGRLTLANIPFNGARAYEYLKQICAIGPRFSGSTGMQEQQKLLAAHFSKLGGTVRYQEFRVRHPVDGTAVPMANLIVYWHPDRLERVLLCAHYDTRPYPDRDSNNPKGTFLGANDGASGAALLMELAEHMPNLPGKLGVDFVLFDGEELVYQDGDPYFLGSEWFARDYAANAPPHRYRWGVLLDMIGDARLEIYQEKYSIGWRDTRPLVGQIWAVAKRLGVSEFSPRRGYEVRDDHLALHDTAKIPTCDLIDFDYPYWHTAGDTPDKCSALSLAKVGWVIHEWLKEAGAAR